MIIKNKLSRKSKKLKFSLSEQLPEKLSSISGGNIIKIKSKKLMSRKIKSRKYRLRKSLNFPYRNGDIVYITQEV